MAIAPLFETCMLVCFGFSWPLNVVKAYKARTAKGTSLAFILLIITGYLAGITAKVVTEQFNYVLAVYFLNLAIVMANLFVFARNKNIDRAEEAKRQLLAANGELINTAEEVTMNYSYSLHNFIHKTNNNQELKNEVILLGGTADTNIPARELAKSFNCNFEIYNKSQNGLSLAMAMDHFNKVVAPLSPEGIILHLGAADIDLFKQDPETFNQQYLKLIAAVKKVNRKCRLALVSVDNPQNDSDIKAMNNTIKALAAAEKTTFVNLDNAKLWHPEATQAAIDFAYNMGLNTRKPLGDVAEILFGYSYNH